jgi:hypothetical protein
MSPVIFRAECDCGREVVRPTPRVSEFLSVGMIRVRSACCDAIVHATPDALGSEVSTGGGRV